MVHAAWKLAGVLGYCGERREGDYLAVFPSVPQGAGAAVGTQAVNTRPRIQARVRAALIDVMEAEGTSETHGAQTRERVDSVNTCATVEAGAEERMRDNISYVSRGSARPRSLAAESRMWLDKHLWDSNAYTQEVLKSSKLD